MTPEPGLIETLDAIRRGAIDPQGAIDASWARAEAIEPAIEAFAYRPATPPHAGTGPWAGIAVGIKDLIDTADMPTTYGSAAYAGHRPQADAWIVARLRSLGATVLGKTVSTEFAWQHPGPTRNPWNHDHTPGGSSSGSAAAVGAGVVPLAVGTQTFGSVIRPAAFCGIFGYKPTFGLLPRDGVHPLSGSLDHVGLFARSAADITFAMAALAPNMPPESAAPDGQPRLAFVPLPQEGIEPAQRAAFEAALDRLRQQGIAVAPWTAPDGFDAIPGLAQTLLAYEAGRIFRLVVDANADRISAPFQNLVATGLTLADDVHAEAVARQHTLRAAFQHAMDGLDALLTIPALGEAPNGLASTGDPRFCLGWTFLGCPALSIPVARGPQGLPIGLQLVGKAGDDANLLRLAERLPLA